ncbi:undecaprenyl-diphosphate phosphatase [Phytoactinopolyspora limicola]|uniref:undecaprenyl-diphosphate phosphatase n=1 Tax=Phytoactinopolyspora limicola TaxID=2715536 RepID=UPI0014073388|nr:undecaprenyl-diphosphate phosphatase [Phytoactinopolyspora limicola]
MEWFQAAVLGVLQGLTEFLPISSSAHLRIYPQLFGWPDPGAAFTAVTQIGTETAVILYFIKDIARIISAWVRSRAGTAGMRNGSDGPGTLPRQLPYDPADVRLGWYVIIGTIPIVVAGITFKNVIEHDFRSLWIVGTTLVVFGVILGVADRLGRRERDVRGIGLRDACLVGAAQALALIPGVSRSGASISMGLLLGLDRATAARFAFLLAIPAVLGAGIYEWPSAIAEGSVFGIGPTLLATAIAFVVGYAVIAWLFRWLERRSFAPFVAYRIVLGALTLILLGTGTLSPFA